MLIKKFAKLSDSLDHMPNGTASEVKVQPENDVYDFIDSVCSSTETTVPIITAEKAASAELNHYWALSKLGSKEDPLCWWANHTTFLPLMSQVARRLLCTQATTGVSERIFSVSGNVISEKLSRLTCEKATDLIFLNGCWEELEEYEQKKRRRQA